MELLKDGIDALTDRNWAIGRRQEVAEAGQDDGVGLSADALQGLIEDGEVTAGNHLGILQENIATAGVLIHISSNVRVTEKCEATELRHLDEVGQIRKRATETEAVDQLSLFLSVKTVAVMYLVKLLTFVASSKVKCELVSLDRIP